MTFKLMDIMHVITSEMMSFYQKTISIEVLLKFLRYNIVLNPRFFEKIHKPFKQWLITIFQNLTPQSRERTEDWKICQILLFGCSTIDVPTINRSLVEALECITTAKYAAFILEHVFNEHFSYLFDQTSIEAIYQCLMLCFHNEKHHGSLIICFSHVSSKIRAILFNMAINLLPKTFNGNSWNSRTDDSICFVLRSIIKLEPESFKIIEPKLYEILVEFNQTIIDNNRHTEEDMQIDKTLSKTTDTLVPVPSYSNDKTTPIIINNQSINDLFNYSEELLHFLMNRFVIVALSINHMINIGVDSTKWCSLLFDMAMAKPFWDQSNRPINSRAKAFQYSLLSAVVNLLHATQPTDESNLTLTGDGLRHMIFIKRQRSVLKSRFYSHHLYEQAVTLLRPHIVSNVEIPTDISMNRFVKLSQINRTACQTSKPKVENKLQPSVEIKHKTPMANQEIEEFNDTLSTESYGRNNCQVNSSGISKPNTQSIQSINATSINNSTTGSTVPNNQIVSSWDILDDSKFLCEFNNKRVFFDRAELKIISNIKRNYHNELIESNL